MKKNEDATVPRPLKRISVSFQCLFILAKIQFNKFNHGIFIFIYFIKYLPEAFQLLSSNLDGSLDFRIFYY